MGFIYSSPPRNGYQDEIRYVGDLGRTPVKEKGEAAQEMRRAFRPQYRPDL